MSKRADVHPIDVQISERALGRVQEHRQKLDTV